MQTDLAQKVGGHVMQELLLVVHSLVRHVLDEEFPGEARALDVGLGQLVQGQRGGASAPHKSEESKQHQHRTEHDAINTWQIICCDRMTDNLIIVPTPVLFAPVFIIVIIIVVIVTRAGPVSVRASTSAPFPRVASASVPVVPGVSPVFVIIVIMR